MKIKELPLNEIQIGLRVLGLKSKIPGTVVKIDPNDDHFCWVQFDNESRATGGWYGNNCECEVILDDTTNKPIIAMWKCANGHTNFGIHVGFCSYCPPSDTKMKIAKKALRT